MSLFIADLDIIVRRCEYLSFPLFPLYGYLASFSYALCIACKIINDSCVYVFKIWSQEDWGECVLHLLTSLQMEILNAIQDLKIEDADEYLLWNPVEATRVFGEGNYITNDFDPCMESA